MSPMSPALQTLYTPPDFKLQCLTRQMQATAQLCAWSGLHMQYPRSSSVCRWRDGQIHTRGDSTWMYGKRADALRSVLSIQEVHKPTHD